MSKREYRISQRQFLTILVYDKTQWQIVQEHSLQTHMNKLRREFELYENAGTFQGVLTEYFGPNYIFSGY